MLFEALCRNQAYFRSLLRELSSVGPHHRANGTNGDSTTGTGKTKNHSSLPPEPCEPAAAFRARDPLTNRRFPRRRDLFAMPAACLAMALSFAPVSAAQAQQAPIDFADHQ